MAWRAKWSARLEECVFAYSAQAWSPASLSEIIPGDVVLYSRGDRLYAHRTVALVGSNEGPRLVTRGDRLSYNDPPVSATELLGRVTSIEARDGRAHRPVQPVAQESVWKKMVVQILRKSDRATYLYLRIARLWPTFSSGRAACRA